MRMEDHYPYPVFIECSDILSEQNKKKIENYFKIKRKSGGGQCGPVTTAAETYCIAFKHQRDQQEVLRRCEHTVELSSGHLVFIVTDKPLSSDSSSTSVSTAPVERAVSNENNWDCNNTGNRCLPDAPNERRIVILGKTGCGKSSVANTIFGEDKFNVWHSSISAESPCEAKTKSLNGKEITLIDTPGFFDTNKPEEDLKHEIVKCITECSPGPHAFLIVLQLGRFTDQENDIVKKITQYFSEEVFRFATVVFTHGDDLQEELELTEYLRPNVLLDELVKKCGGRCHVIDNKYWKNPSDETYRSNTYQVKEILKSVEEIVKANNGNCYTNEMLQAVEEMTQQEEERIALSSGNMSREEIRRRAKSRVCDILKKTAGITTGVLLGAFFGVAASIGIVIMGIKTAADLKGLALLSSALIKSATKALGTSGAVTGVTTGTAAEASSDAPAGPAGITATVVGTAGAVVVGTGAVAGAAFGAYKGYQAAEESETPWEAATKTAEVVCSSGKEAINKVNQLRTKCQDLVKKMN